MYHNILTLLLKKSILGNGKRYVWEKMGPNIRNFYDLGLNRLSSVGLL